MRRLILAPGSVCGGSSQALAGPARPGHWLLDTGTMLMRLSPGFGEMLGIGQAASLPFRTFLEMMHPEDRGRVEALADVLPPEVSPSFDESVRVVRPDGAVMRIVLKGEVETAPGGGIVSVFGTAEEVPRSGEGQGLP